jgi:hypothetical protein
MAIEPERKREHPMASIMRPWLRDRPVVRTLLVVAFYLCALNFLAFVVVSANIGGSADLGREEGGRYFVGDHGKLNEVSESVYRSNKLHGLSLWITHPLGFLIGLLMWRFPNPLNMLKRP